MRTMYERFTHGIFIQNQKVTFFIVDEEWAAAESVKPCSYFTCRSRMRQPHAAIPLQKSRYKLKNVLHLFTKGLRHAAAAFKLKIFNFFYVQHWP